MKILLVGGGSGGPVAPLLAIADEIKKTHPQAKFLFVGGKTGPERQMAERAGFKFIFITSGKFRRYFSWTNFLAPIQVAMGFFQSLKIIKTFRPDCVFGAGSFVQVPMVWAAWWKGIPSLIHQQDVVPSLANRLCQWPAKKITVSLEISLTSFPSTVGIFYTKHKEDKIILTGNPFREDLRHGSKDRAGLEFGLSANLPVLLVLGGGTGAQFFNTLMAKAGRELGKSVQILHSTGQGKNQKLDLPNYHAYEFIDNMADAYAAADIVVARAGLSTITELSHLKKASIIIPMPMSHQEVNGWWLMEQDAAIVLKQQRVKPEAFVSLIRKLLFSLEAQQELQKNISKIMPHTANSKISELIVKIIAKK